MVEEFEIIKPAEWLPESRGFMVVSGPCSAESPEQVMETAVQLARTGLVNILRAGIWKPRTRPSTFEGVGRPGLPWLAAAGKATGLKTATEVATPAHVEAALNEGIDILWIGARTSANPFSVQEIADSLQGVNVPVLVKNPINPDLNLWVGAIERIYNAGVKKLVAVHRGFSTYHKQFRNAPHWEIPIQLKAMIPALPVICDPSHISGSRQHLQEVSQKSIDLDMDGLMIETHIDPDNALSDSKQQLTPDAFAAMMSRLKYKSSSIESPVFRSKLEELRSQIDRIDTEFIEYIAQRMQIARDIGKYKQENNVTVLQIERWREILETRIPLARSLGLEDRFIERLLELIHDESIRIQTKIKNENCD